MVIAKRRDGGYGCPARMVCVCETDSVGNLACDLRLLRLVGGTMTERRTERRMVGFTCAELAEVERAAYNAGQSVSEYARSITLASARSATTATRAPDWGSLREAPGTSTDQAMP